MKKLLLLLAVMISFSCTEEPYFNFVDGWSDSIVADSDVSVHTVQFSTNLAWKASSSESWIMVTPSSGGPGNHSVALKVNENINYEKRVATVTLTAEGMSRSIAVTQNPREGYVIEETSFHIGSAGGTVSVPVSANVEYSVSVEDESSSWLSVTQTKGLGNYIIKLSVKKNTGYDERTGHVSLSAGGQVSTISVIQSQLDEMIIGPVEYEIDNLGGEIEVPVSSNVDYSCSVLGGVDWITITDVKTKGLEDSHVLLTIKANENYDGRVGQVKISGANKESIITVTQYQKDEMIVSATEYEIGSGGGKINVEVHSNVDYEYEVLPSAKDWITVSNVKTKGLEKSTMVLTVKANVAYDNRVGQVKVSAAGKECVITVSQSQLDELILATTEYEIGSDGGEIRVPVQSNVEYQYEVLKNGREWITASCIRTKGLEESFIVLNVKENKSYGGRTGQVRVSGAYKESIITVTQGLFGELILTTTEYEIGSAGGEIKVLVLSNMDYDYEVLSSGNGWITATSVKTRSLEETLLVLKVDDNKGYDGRVGQVRVYGAGKESIITVNQSQFDELKLVKTEYEIGSEGGEIVVDVLSNVDYEYEVLSSANGWITVRDAKTKGLEESSVVLEVSSNESFDGRAGQIRLFGSDKVNVITVNQSGKQGYYDLSSGGTANCYIVSNPGYYKFEATKGNSSESFYAASYAEVLWETFGTDVTPDAGDLVSEVGYSEGYVYFYASDRKGNASVAVKDESGRILWSWHIWMTDEPDEQVYRNNAGIMLDRNLGAISATPGDVGALGLMYQWGRKDPFLGSSSVSNGVIAKSVNSLEWAEGYSIECGTIQYAIAHPTTFIRANNNNHDWYFSDEERVTDNTRWKADKTIYDPCPVGYRVPDGGKNGVWAKAFGDPAYFKSGFDNVNRGFDFGRNSNMKSLTDEKVCWYPATGFKSGINYTNNLGDSGEYASHTPLIDEYGNFHFSYNLYYYMDGIIDPSNIVYRSYAQAVRCLKEDSFVMEKNLSEKGTANSYIVSESGHYKFSAVQGNSSISVGQVYSVEVLWESFGTNEMPSKGDLISSVSYFNNSIAFSVPNEFREGNAVIAAKDASGNILWSWHIWLTDKPKDQVYRNNAGTMMDRNLGATSATPGDVGALGLMYQWGRKDPFLGSSVLVAAVQAESVGSENWKSVSSSSYTGTIAFSISNPMMFIFSNNSGFDWYYSSSSSSLDMTRWDSEKTIYDPCPVGYRVPDGGENGVWTTALGTSEKLVGNYDQNNLGFDFGRNSSNIRLTDEPTCWYPAAGYRTSSDGSLANLRYVGGWWDCSNRYSAPYGFYISYDNEVCTDVGFASCGHSVRCLRDN